MSKEMIIPPSGFVPYVFRKNGQLYYRFPVASGHSDFSFTFEITDAHLQVLQNDKMRFNFLYAVLHGPFQLEPRPSAAEVRVCIDTILLGDERTVIAFLNDRDDGVISGMVNTLSGRKVVTFGTGQWFKN